MQAMPICAKKFQIRFVSVQMFLLRSAQLSMYFNAALNTEGQELVKL